MRTARNLGDPSMRSQYNRILRRIDNISAYLDRMSDVIEDTADEAIRMYGDLNAKISGDSDNVKNTYGKIML